MKKVISINIYSGPGTGKSTNAAYILYILKKMHFNVELISEFAKDLTYEKAFNVLENQVFVFGNQQHRMYRTHLDVDILVCDSPLLLGLQYADKDLQKYLEPLTIYEYNKYNNINIFLERNTVYNIKGRNQTLEEAIVIDNNILNILDRNNINYIKISPINNEDKIIEYILKEINRYNNE